MAAYEDAVRELYQAPLARFVAERKRLAGELRAAGDRTGATELGKRARPTISAWAVNQLWWHARDAFDALLATAERLRAGELAASTAHRDAIAKLRQRAAAMLEDAGHAASEAVLRRVTATLSAIAATGSFDPDPPGALAADRDPPGFEAAGIPTGPPSHKPHDGHARDAAAQRRARETAQRELAEAAEAAERKRREASERAKRLAERHRLEAALRTARGDIAAREREVRALEQQVAAAEKAVIDARAIAEDLERELTELGD